MPRFPNRLAAIAAALLLALGTLAPAPAKAGPHDRDLFNFLVGATAAVIILRSLDDPVVDRQPPHQYWRPWPGPHPGHRPAHLYLPPACGHVWAPHGGRDVIYLASCLRNAGYHWDLPAHCAVTVMTNRGPRRGYSAACLTRAGYICDGYRGW